MAEFCVCFFLKRLLPVILPMISSPNSFSCRLALLAALDYAFSTVRSWRQARQGECCGCRGSGELVASSLRNHRETVGKFQPSGGVGGCHPLAVRQLDLHSSPSSAGRLRRFDQATNINLDESHKRVYSTQMMAFHVSSRASDKEVGRKHSSSSLELVLGVMKPFMLILSVCV